MKPSAVSFQLKEALSLPEGANLHAISYPGAARYGAAAPARLPPAIVFRPLPLSGPSTDKRARLAAGVRVWPRISAKGEIHGTAKTAKNAKKIWINLKRRQLETADRWCKMKTMTPEERFERIERQLEFLAANQTHHDAHMAELSKRTEDNARQIGELSGLTMRIGRIVEVQAGHIDKLADRMGELAESQQRTDVRLNALINIVERYFSNGRK